MSNVARNAPANSQLARNCVVCGKPFSGSGRALYCSPACRLRAFRLRHLQDQEVLRLEADQGSDHTRSRLTFEVGCGFRPWGDNGPRAAGW
jgi:hypothetical protein